MLAVKPFWELHRHTWYYTRKRIGKRSHWNCSMRWLLKDCSMVEGKTFRNTFRVLCRQIF
jgi:hypothetical protein